MIRSFEGGSEAFLSLTWTSHISSFESLRPHLVINPPSQTQIANAAHSVGADLSLPQLTQLNVTAPDLLTRFLLGHGIPCPGLFKEVKGHFDAVVNLSRIDHPSFRSQMLCWAASGSPTVNINAENIQVCRTLYLEHSSPC